MPDRDGFLTAAENNVSEITPRKTRRLLTLAGSAEGAASMTRREMILQACGVAAMVIVGLGAPGFYGAISWSHSIQDAIAKTEQADIARYGPLAERVRALEIEADTNSQAWRQTTVEFSGMRTELAQLGAGMRTELTRVGDQLSDIKVVLAGKQDKH